MLVLFIGNVNSFLIINLAIKLKESYPEIVIDILSDSKARTAEASAGRRRSGLGEIHPSPSSTPNRGHPQRGAFRACRRRDLRPVQG